MSNGSVTQMQGLGPLLAKFQAMSSGVQGKIARASVRAMGAPVKKEIVKQAPYDAATKDNTHIRKNVVVGRSRSKSRYGQEVFTVGIKLGKKTLQNGHVVKTEGDTWYWKLIEFGTSKMPAQPFIRPAAATAAPAAFAAFEKKFSEEIAKIVQGPP